MSRIYATEESGARHLVALECDGCGVRIKPCPEIANSGWSKLGWDRGPGTERTELDFCATCTERP